MLTADELRNARIKGVLMTPIISSEDIVTSHFSKFLLTESGAKKLVKVISPILKARELKARQEERERIRKEIEKHRVYDLIDISGITPYVPLKELRWWNELWQALNS